MSFIKRNFRLLLCALAVLLLVTGISAYFGRTAIPTGSWGLSFQKEGQAPIGNATESLRASMTPSTRLTAQKRYSTSPLTPGMKTETPAKSWTF